MKTIKETIAQEVKSYINNNVKDMAESHLQAWKDRYSLMGLKEIKQGLYNEHDPSLEIEEVEEAIRRKLNEKEQTYVVDQFNRAVIKIRR